MHILCQPIHSVTELAPLALILIASCLFHVCPADTEWSSIAEWT